MRTDTIVLLMLVAVFAMAGVHHLLIWIRHAAAREHLWFGVASLAAAGAAGTHCMAVDGRPGSGPVTAQLLSTLFVMGWLVAATLFSVEYAADDRRGRRRALLASLLIATVSLAGLLLPSGGQLARAVSADGLLRGLAAVALAVMLWLLAGTGLRLWASARWNRAAVQGVLGIAVGAVALQGIWPGQEFRQLPSPFLFVFLIVVMLMTVELAGAVAEGKEVSQRQRQELAHASRLSVVGELTASIAHEINQPLSAILSNADAGEILLEGAHPSLEEIKRILGDIRRDGLRASDVIRHVRKLVRKRELELEQLDANAVATGVIALLEQEARRRGISIASVLSPGPIPLHADRTLLEQTLINLMLNAMDAVETVVAADPVPLVRPPIALGVSTLAHGEIEFRVVDAGPGIPGEQLGHLFDSFYTSKSHGMGLGLSIARSIVEAHGGRIQAENNPVAGATFRVTLPPCDRR